MDWRDGAARRVFGDNLVYARKDSRLRQREAAESLHLAVGYLAEIEAGERVPSQEELFAFSELYDFTIDRLTGSSLCKSVADVI